MNARVAALVATHRRPREVARLLSSLAQIPHGLELVVVVDNAGCSETRAAVELARCKTRYLAPGKNLGCGGGLKRAGEEALATAGDRLTHLLILDDDAVLQPGTIDGLLEAMEREKADAACPLVIGPHGDVGWLPGLGRRSLQKRGEQIGTPAEFRARIGAQPREFSWTQGICLLVSRRAIDAVGLHRDDFWIRGEDLEFSLRLTSAFRGILVPTVEVQHLPPQESSASSREAEFLRHAALVQNVAYVGLKLKHGRRIAWTLLPNIARFVRMWGLRGIPAAARAAWRGGIRGEAAGQGTGSTFLAQFTELQERR